MMEDSKDFVKIIINESNKKNQISDPVVGNEQPINVNKEGMVNHPAVGINKEIISAERSDFAVNYQNLFSNSRNESDTSKLQNHTNFDVLKSIKTNLEDIFNSLNYLKSRIVENIQAKQNIQNNISSIPQNFINQQYSQQSDASVTPNENTLCDLFNNANSYINKYFEQNKSGNENNNFKINSTNTDIADCKPLNNIADNKCNNSIKTFNNISSIPQDIEVINLLSGDEGSNSDSDMVSNKSESIITNNSLTPSRLEHSLRKIENNTEFSANETNGVNQNITIDMKNKTKERYSDDYDKQNVKRRKTSENDSDISNQQRFNFSGIFYKVKLTNLHPRVKYSNIASLLKNSGLEYVDILLVKHHHSRMAYAEISFSHLENREKAVSMDKTLSYLGQKITITAI